MITVQRVAKAAGKHLTRAGLKLRKALGARPSRACPACGGMVVGFFRYGGNAEWGCPDCGASPRERLMNHLIAQGVLSVPANGAILHMAPNEGSLVKRFSAAKDYVPADLDPARYDVPGMRRVDLMALADADRYDLFYASHVMEHVPDDRAVLGNILRALKPGGEAWLIVPLWDKPTEDGSFDIPPRERERRFGQWDHVRQYGPDFADRIRQAGFDLEEIDAASIDADTRHLHGLDDRLFRARKSEGATPR
ncbi:SAM-dependent methyltransferase [Sphingobium wenxiniae]|uniref:Methyltransferase family protein n=1 Tax=Sphingobium wenxiniae (strain DSM 21828 / CGMCC 1.7748 / JZ-1) TaxID=595605 RepID=A0A562KQH7_SPHWJ|nr:MULTISPECIES: methyltransferase domain-containing protein [Sphingobium]KMS63475.1 glycosyl transferase [Sphingobium baderi LL03]MBB6190007.1 SAM-dependent methyltransferase [Sphingobium wenxiniae]TWH97678.1 methyltransferase family protein [Sphingobium wenxiniae]